MCQNARYRSQFSVIQWASLKGPNRESLSIRSKSTSVTSRSRTHPCSTWIKTLRTRLSCTRDWVSGNAPLHTRQFRSKRMVQHENACNPKTPNAQFWRIGPCDLKPAHQGHLKDVDGTLDLKWDLIPLCHDSNASKPRDHTRRKFRRRRIR